MGVRWSGGCGYPPGACGLRRTRACRRFVNELSVVRTQADRRLGLRNREFVVHRAGASERRTLDSVAQIRQVLENEFLIRLPAQPQLDSRLESLPVWPASQADAATGDVFR
ncbi:MAG TPA: arylamine N-acetyltransferase [Rhodanobacter sp.]